MKAFRGLWLVLLVGGLTGTAGAQAGPWQGFTVLAAAPDGRQVVTGGRSGEVLLWDSATGEAQGRWVVGTGQPVAGLAFQAGGLRAVLLDGSRWNLGSEGAEVRAADPAEAPGAAEAQGGAVRKGKGPLTAGSSAAGPWGRAEGTPEGRVTFTAASGTPVTWTAGPAAVVGLAWVGPDRLVTALATGDLALWEASSGRLWGRL